MFSLIIFFQSYVRVLIFQAYSDIKGNWMHLKREDCLGFETKIKLLMMRIVELQLINEIDNF